MSIWRGIGWVLGVALAGMVPQAHERLERFRGAELVDLPPLGLAEDTEEAEWEEAESGVLGGSAGTAKGKKPRPKPLPKAPPAKKPATRNRTAAAAPKAPAKPRGRPPLNDGLTPAERRAAKAKREQQLATLAKARAVRAANLAAKKGATN